MLSRTSTFMLALLFSLNTFASPESGMKMAFDEFTYSMEVEGGFQDQSIARKAKDQLESDIQNLLESGVTARELLEGSFKLVKNEVVRAQLNGLLHQLEEGSLSKDQFMNQLNNSLSASYHKGASWNGSEVAGIAGVFVLFIAIMIIPRLIFMSNCPKEDRAGDGVCRKPEMDENQ